MFRANQGGAHASADWYRGQDSALVR